jgi:hypothetical protein
MSADDVEGRPPMLRSGAFPISGRPIPGLTSGATSGPAADSTSGLSTVDAPGRDGAQRVIDLIGEENARALLVILALRDDDRLAFVARLYQRRDGYALAEVLTDIESDPDDLVRLRLIRGLRSVLGPTR